MRLVSATTANSEAAAGEKDVLVFLFITRSLDFAVKSARRVIPWP
jgi:hypothetical protein